MNTFFDVKIQTSCLKIKTFRLNFRDSFGVLHGIMFLFFQMQTIKYEKLCLLNTLCWAENTSQFPAEVIITLSV